MRCKKMQVITRSKTIDGTAIQIENWNNDYPTLYAKNSTVALYPISKQTIYKSFNPTRGESFRYSLSFDNEEKAMTAYKLLITGEKKLIDYIDNYNGTFLKDDVILCIN